MRTISLFSSILLFVAPALLAQAPPPAAAVADWSLTAAAQAKLVALGKEDNQAMAHLDHLVNTIGPRLTGSDRLTTACEWAVEQFKSFGIKNARLEEWGTFPVGFNRGKLSGKMIGPEELEFDLTTPAWVGGTEGPVRGPAVLAPKDLEELEAVRETLKGAWLVQRAGGGRERRSRELREALSKAYDEIGILGLVRPGAPRNLVHTYGNHHITWETRPLRPEVIVRLDQWELLAKHLEAGTAVSLEFNLDNRFKEGPVKLYNVVADIPGTDLPHECVIVGGHIDSWDGATGTTDNGTGVATTLEAARLLMAAGIKPRRTIRFMLWSGEEQGLLGSWGWIQKNPDVLEHISAVLVHDGGTNFVSGINATPAMLEDVKRVFEPLAKISEGMPFKVNEVIGLPEGIGSDHDSFLRKNVPGFFWNQDGRADYNYTHHTQNDTYQSAIADYQKHSSTVIAAGALGIANLERLLDRTALRVRVRRLGITMDEDGSVGEVGDGTVAHAAGLKKGDKIVEIEGKKIENRGDFRRAMTGAGNTRAIVVLRDGKQVTLTATWTEAAEE